MHLLEELPHVYFQIQFDVVNIKICVSPGIQSAPLPVPKSGWYQMKASYMRPVISGTNASFVYLLLTSGLKCD